MKKMILAIFVLTMGTTFTFAGDCGCKGNKSECTCKDCKCPTCK